MFEQVLTVHQNGLDPLKSLSQRERNVLVPCLRRGMQTGGSASIVQQEAEPPEARFQAEPGNEVSLRQQGVDKQDNR